MDYELAERFHSLQGEGTYTGTPMAFVRFVGCSIGKKICSFCDTDFEKPLSWRGGGTFSAEALVHWAAPSLHMCLTGGEPLDQDLASLIHEAKLSPLQCVHVETSGTKPLPACFSQIQRKRLWICVSPKPGFLDATVLQADEVKVIVPGLGVGSGWPDLQDAKRWADAGKTVFLQPRNAKYTIDQLALRHVTDLLHENPSFRLSLQLHKMLNLQ